MNASWQAVRYECPPCQEKVVASIFAPKVTREKVFALFEPGVVYSIPELVQRFCKANNVPLVQGQDIRRNIQVTLVSLVNINSLERIGRGLYRISHPLEERDRRKKASEGLPPSGGLELFCPNNCLLISTPNIATYLAFLRRLSLTAENGAPLCPSCGVKMSLKRFDFSVSKAFEVKEEKPKQILWDFYEAERKRKLDGKVHGREPSGEMMDEPFAPEASA